MPFFVEFFSLQMRLLLCVFSFIIQFGTKLSIGSAVNAVARDAKETHIYGRIGADAIEVALVVNVDAI